MKYLSLAAIFVFVLLPEFSSAAGFVNCSGTDCSACNLVQMGNDILKWLIGVMMVIFAVLLVVAGMGLVTSGGNPAAKTAAKEKLTNAIIGLVIVLAAWLIVDTIIRSLVSGGTGQINGKFWYTVDCQTQVTPVTVAWGGDPGSPYAASTVTHTDSCGVNIATGKNTDCTTVTCPSPTDTKEIDNSDPDNLVVNCWDIKAGTPPPLQGTPPAGCTGGNCVALTIPCKPGVGCSISPDLVAKFSAFHAAANVTGARVTEAMPPTRVHKSPCHTNGTCVDYSKSGGMTTSEVISVINAAKNNGLRPVYEVKTQAEKNVLVSQGASEADVKVLGSWISAPHFSIYGS